ncbi:BQ2448_3274 [Microbotryum intermedium]|uniref:BQ2448_3274 protein n=1 Tax=Microbotryum intermedium TaxID=269621 RepID=A0A238FKU4_9BASI|nr:BQ2448_3274 [Microbotryum intermedium]
MLYTYLITIFAVAVSTSALPKTKCGSACNCETREFSGREDAVMRQTGLLATSIKNERIRVCIGRLLDIVGSFQYSDWQDFSPLLSPLQDNKKGSKRTVALGALSLIEEIESYKVDKKRDTTTTVFFLNNCPTTVGDNTITYYRVSSEDRGAQRLLANGFSFY